MPSCKILSAKSVIRALCKLFRRPRQNGGASHESLVDEGQGSETAKESPPSPVDDDFEPRVADAVRQYQPPLPPSCSRLRSGDVRILGDYPSRAGAFADVWDGSLAGDRVVIKAYRIYSTADSTQACMVRLRRYLQQFCFVDPPSVTEAL